MLKLIVIEFFCLKIAIEFQTRLFVHYRSNYTHCEETTAVLLIFSVNAFNLSWSLRFLISLQVLQCALFHLRYVIDNTGMYVKNFFMLI